MSYSKNNFLWMFLPLWIGYILSPGLVSAQRHEVGLLLGGVSAGERQISGGAARINSDVGVVLQANYGFRLLSRDNKALYLETHFAANPLTQLSSSSGLVPLDYASLFVAPGLRLKFLTGSEVSPYVAVGGGYALFEQSTNQIDGRPNAGPRFTHRGTLGFAGGADFKVWRFLGVRVEVRDFLSGNPAFNVRVSGSLQHNVIGSGGIVLSF